MKTKVGIWTDHHKGAPNEIPFNFVGTGHLKHRLSLGDNHDFANCDRDKINSLKRELQEDTAWFTQMIYGNHERLTLNNQLIVIGDTVFAHGDFESWGTDRAHQYRSKPHGASWFKRTFIVNAIEYFESHFDREPREDFYQRAVAVAKLHNCGRYVCGHFHPRNRITKTVEGIEVIVLPRGFSEIEVIDGPGNERNRSASMVGRVL